MSEPYTTTLRELATVYTINTGGALSADESVDFHAEIARELDIAAGLDDQLDEFTADRITAERARQDAENE